MIQIQSFNVNQPTRILFGVHALNRLSEMIAELGGSRVFLVADPGLQKAGIIKQITDILAGAKIPYALYDRVAPEPGLRLAKKD